MRSVGATSHGGSRVWAVTLLLGGLVAYDYAAPHLWHAGVWGNVAWIALVLMPATFGLVLIVLPLVRMAGTQLLMVGLAFVALSLALAIAHAHVAANYSRLAAATLLAFAAVHAFERVGEAVLISVVIPWIDAYSVWRGPTKTITTKHPQVFRDFSFAFLTPGANGAANLGVPDLLFFAFFLGIAWRFKLRVVSTFIGMLAALAITFFLVQATGANGLPALPADSLGFLLPNADLLWAQLRRKPGLGDGADVPLDGTPNDS
jgi:hypothetical protein